jgi:GT2 family glycosyltransferase
MQLSIIIVNYKQTDIAIQCIESIYSNAGGDVLFEIILVDNASDDDCELIFSEKFPKINFIQMGYNAGFARANNAGISAAKGDSVLLLNSDTIIEKNAIELCYKKFIFSDYVACGVQLLNRDRSPQISGNYAMTGGLNYLLPLPYIGSMLKSISNIFNIKKPNVPEAKDDIEVDWINGAFLMVKSNAYEQAGLLDEEFFLYAEEAEWCSRLKRIGSLCIFGEYNVIHLQGETSKDAFGSDSKGYFDLTDKKGLQIIVSNFLRIRKEFGLVWFIVDLLLYCVSVPVSFLMNLLYVLLPKRKKEFTFNKWVGFSKNIWKLCLLSPKIVSRKKYFYKVL